jgi:hypothetical protein
LFKVVRDSIRKPVLSEASRVSSRYRKIDVIDDVTIEVATKIDVIDDVTIELGIKNDVIYDVTI